MTEMLETDLPSFPMARECPMHPPAEYREITVTDHPSGGIMETPKEMPANVPSYWMPYFQVANLDSSVGTATARSPMAGRLTYAGLNLHRRYDHILCRVDRLRAFLRACEVRRTV